MSQYQWVTVLSVELHVSTRADLLPDPEFDEISAVFYAIHTDSPPASHEQNPAGPQTGSNQGNTPSSSQKPMPSDGIIMKNSAKDDGFLHKTGLHDLNITYVNTEQELLAETVELVKR